MHIERNGKILTWTWKNYLNDASAFAKSLHSLGISNHACVNILGHNAPEWPISFIGTALYNGISSGVYPTNT